MMIPRSREKKLIEDALRRSRAALLLGPRQCGKTTLARQFVAPDSPNYFDLEDPQGLARLEQPMTALRDLRGLVVIDEIQRKPDLFAILRVLVDRRPLPARFLVLGSAGNELLRQSSETLAGRLAYIHLAGFSLKEIGVKNNRKHWLRGGFPESFLAKSEKDSLAWRKAFIQTLAERDIPMLGISIPHSALMRFWQMLAHYHGNIWNAAELSRCMGVGENTARRYLDVINDMFMVRQLPPWHENLAKRQIKSPKIYFRDTGILHSLLGIADMPQLEGHPKCGFSWEGYAIEEIIKAYMPDSAYFWGTHAGAELDLLLIKNGKKLGFECKRADAPKATVSMHIALADLALEKIIVVYPGTARYKIAERIEAVPLGEIVMYK